MRHRLFLVRGQETAPAAQNPTLAVSLNAADLTLVVIDRRTGHRWTQKVGPVDAGAVRRGVDSTPAQKRSKDHEPRTDAMTARATTCNRLAME